MATSREDALASKGRYGKIDIGAHFIYGQVVDVHPQGDHVKFQRGSPLRFQAKWYHRNQLDLHPLRDGGEPDA